MHIRNIAPGRDGLVRVQHVVPGGCVRKAYSAPKLVNFGRVADLTAGGSSPRGTEFVIYSCKSQNAFFRC